jgi:predicted RNA-binding protein with PIN domain
VPTAADSLERGFAVPYVIDGNNLLGSWGGPRPGEDRRAEVVRRVAAFCRARGARARIVFDGQPLRADLEAQELGPVSLRVPAVGETADDVIKRMVDQSARPADLIVVTSDKPLYSYCRTRGAAVLRVHEWNSLARQASPAASAADEGKPEHEPDVEGWLKLFGGK